MKSRRDLFMRVFGSAVLMQALLSGTSFIVGLILIRRSSDLQYGYYILTINALLLLTTLQGAFIQPQMVVRMTRLDSTGRRDMVGGLLREQRALLLRLLIAAVIGVLLLCAAGRLEFEQALLVVLGTLVATAVLTREFFRMLLFAYRQPQSVLRADTLYVTLLLCAAWLATYTPIAAITAVAGLGAAAWISSRLLARSSSTHEGWNPGGAPGILRQLAPLGAWSVGGAAIHWALSQGYSYLAAGTLSVKVVAAIAATRLLLMPVNLLSAGIGTVLLPLTSDWLHRLGLQTALRRLLALAGALIGGALIYFAVLWLNREWIFATVLRKDFAQRDAMLLLWCAVFLLMLIRDQLVNLLAALERFRQLTLITGGSAALSLTASYLAMLHLGGAGAVLGILLGEAANVAGIGVLVVLETRRALPEPAPA
jgi:O-antigen/teichoic acid export membrane protein